MNKVILIGNLTRDPEGSVVGDNVNVSRFGLAVQKRFAAKDAAVTADFFNIVAWRGLADTCNKYLKKGNKVGISGYIQVRNYEQDGVKKIAVDIIAEEVEFLTPKSSDGGNGSYDEPAVGAPAKKASIREFKPVDDEDLPF